MFKAIASRVAPEIVDTEGVFLPTSLDDFTLHLTIRLPISCATITYLWKSSVMVLSVSFEVLSHSGELLVSWRKYSVAWVRWI